MTMNPEVLKRVTSQINRYRKNRCGKYSITVSVVESWNKIQKQLKNMLIKDLFPIKLKQLLFLKSYE